MLLDRGPTLLKICGSETTCLEISAMLGYLYMAILRSYTETPQEVFFRTTAPI